MSLSIPYLEESFCLLDSLITLCDRRIGKNLERSYFIANLVGKRLILLLLTALDVCVGTLLRYSKLQSHLSTTKSFVFLCLSSSEHVSFNNI